MKKILFLLALASIAAGAFFALSGAQAGWDSRVGAVVSKVLTAGKKPAAFQSVAVQKATPVKKVAGIKITASANDNLASVKAPDAVLQSLSSLRTQGLSFMANPSDGRLISLSAKTNIIPLTQTVKGADSVAIQFINDYGSSFGLTNASAQVVKDKSETDKQGYVHLRYQRVYNNVPVFASAFLIHENKIGQVKSATGNVLPITSLDTTPNLTNAEAKAKAVEIGTSQFKMTKPEAETATLYIYNKKYINADSADQNYLAYEVAVHDLSDSSLRKNLIINAKNGVLIDSSEGVMADLNRRIYDCYDISHEDSCFDNSSSNTKEKGRFEGDSEVWIRNINTDYDAVKIPYDYYKDKFGLDGANGLGGITDKMEQTNQNIYTPVYTDFKITADLKGGGDAYYNAFSGIHMGIKYSKDEGSRRSAIFHEYTHGVVENQGPSVLAYSGESAVINEAYAQIFTMFIHKYWVKQVLGYDTDMVWTANGWDYANPSSNQPLTHTDLNFGCKITDRYRNLTVLAHLAYLMSEGGELNGTTIAGVGKDTVEGLFFLTLKYLPDNSNFMGFYTAMNSACYQTYTPDTCNEIDKAMRAAELNRSSLCPPPTPDDYYCRLKGYECGFYQENDILDDDGNIRNIRCGTDKNAFNYPYDCPSGKKCDGKKCVMCTSLSDRKACEFRGAYCDKISYYDSCTMLTKTINCDIRKNECPSGWGCDSANHCKPPDRIQSVGGFYNSNGQYDPSGGYYRTVNIKSTYLFKDNFNSGLLQKKTDTPGIATKVCNGDDVKNCPKYGGLYTWWQAMNLPADCATKDCSAQIKSPHQGICPSGFHIPTAKEVDTVVNSLTLPGQTCDASRSNQYDCIDAGAKMQWTGKDDFEAYLFNGQPASFITANQSSATNAWTYAIKGHSSGTGGGDGKVIVNSMLSANSSDGVGRMNTSKNSLASLRCFLDCTPKDGAWSVWKPYGDCGDAGVGQQGYYRTCDAACGGAPCVGNNYKVEKCDPKTSCAGLMKAVGGTLDIYGRVATGAEDSQSGYYATVKLNDKCWMANDLWSSEAVWSMSANRYNWETATKLSYHAQEVPLTLISSAMTQKAVVGSMAARGVCPVGWAIPSNDDVSKLTDSDLPALGYTGYNTVEFWTSQGFVRAAETDPSGVYQQSQGTLHSAVWLYGYYFGGRDWYYEWNLSRLNTNLGWSHYTELKPVRCIKKDSCATTVWKDWQKSGTCGQDKALLQKYVRSCGDVMSSCCQGDSVKYERCADFTDCGTIKYEGGPYDVTGKIRNQGGYYRSVNIGNQCWMRDNLNVGKEIFLSESYLLNNKWHSRALNQSDDSKIEKYCAGNGDCWGSGGSYQWHEAVRLPFACSKSSDYQSSGCIIPSGPRQGICPAGWHLPTIQEWNVMEAALKDSTSLCYVARESNYMPTTAVDQNCEPASLNLRLKQLSGFDVDFNSSFEKQYFDTTEKSYQFEPWSLYRNVKANAAYWAADQVYDFAWDEAKESGYSDPPGSASAYGRFLISTANGVYQELRNKLDALSVRCIRNDKCTGPDKGWEDPSKKITFTGATADYLNVIQSIRQALEGYRLAHGYYPADINQALGNFNITYFYQPSSSLFAQSYNLTYILPEAFCGLPAVSYQATNTSLGLTKTTTGATNPNTTVTTKPPTATTPPVVITPPTTTVVPPVAPPATGLTEAQQLANLNAALNKASVGKPFTPSQLEYIRDPHAFLIKYGYDQALKLVQ